MEYRLYKSIKYRKIYSTLYGFLLLLFYIGAPLILVFALGARIPVTYANNDQSLTTHDLIKAKDIRFHNQFFVPGNHHPFELILVKISTKDGQFLHISSKSNVQEILDEYGEKYDEDDLIFPSLDRNIASGAVIKLVNVEQDTHESTESIPFQTIYVPDPTMSRGEEQISQEGTLGELLKRFRTSYQDGELVSQELFSEEVITPPTDMIIKQGTKEIIPKNSLQSGNCASWDEAIDGATEVEDEREWLKSLMRCESGCNAARVSYNGRYHGLFQFSQATFNNYGGTDIYDGNQQILFALNIVKAGAQYKQFPGCSR